MTCEQTGKRCLSKAEAQRAYQQLLRDDDTDPYRHRLNFYRCQACRRWHVGHRNTGRNAPIMTQQVFDKVAWDPPGNDRALLAEVIRSSADVVVLRGDALQAFARVLGTAGTLLSAGRSVLYGYHHRMPVELGPACAGSAVMRTWFEVPDVEPLLDPATFLQREEAKPDGEAAGV